MVLKNKIVGVGLVGCVACLASAQPYRYYRFTVEATGGEPLQLSEVKLFSGAADVTRRAKQVLWNEQGFNPVFPTYKPQRAVDANLGTKWYDDRMVAADAEVRARTWFTLDYGEPLELSRYEWYTGDDATRYPRRNPTSWRLEGSNDNAAWTVLDAVRGAKPPVENKALAYRRRFSGGPVEGAIDVLDIDPTTGTVTYPEKGQKPGGHGHATVHGFGKTFPGATTPFGMIQLSPDTRTGGDNGPGYSYTHRTIEGFSFLHMSGIGWYGDLGNIQVMPGRANTSRYSHDEEVATAGYYRVRLSDAKVDTELTCSRTTGMIRFTYEEAGEGSLKIDLARRIGELRRAKKFGGQDFRMTGPASFEGRIVCDERDGGWGRGHGHVNYTVFFRGILSKAPTKVGETGGTSNRVVRMDFPVAAGEQVLMHVAVAYDDYPSAPVGFDFDGMHAAAEGLWANALDGIRVKGGTDLERRIFATSLYHAFIDPREIGRGKVGGHEFVRRTIFSGWDCYHSEYPMLTLLRPDVTSDMINSIMDTMVQGKRKWLSNFDVFGCYSDCMIGHPVMSLMADAWEKGIHTFDANLAVDLCRITMDLKGNDRKTGYDVKTYSPLSATLENCHHDWCVAKLADMIGRKDVAAEYYGYAKSYTNSWCHEVGWMRAHVHGKPGVWRAWHGRQQQDAGTAESNPWQQGWFVPHDVEGLMKLMGGKKRFTEELQLFFDRTPADFGWCDTYNHPNEVCHALPFLWPLSEKPEMVSWWTRKILKGAYGLGPWGCCGNDDEGQMGAWCVLAAIGLHPLCPGDGRWYYCAPLFTETTIRLDPKYFKGGTFTIRAPKADAKHWRIVRATLNGKVLDRPYVTSAEVNAGGVLELDLIE